METKVDANIISHVEKRSLGSGKEDINRVTEEESTFATRLSKERSRKCQ